MVGLLVACVLVSQVSLFVKAGQDVACCVIGAMQWGIIYASLSCSVLQTLRLFSKETLCLGLCVSRMSMEAAFATGYQDMLVFLDLEWKRYHPSTGNVNSSLHGVSYPVQPRKREVRWTNLGYR